MTALMLVLSACQGDREHQAGADWPTWEIAATPVVRIGDAESAESALQRVVGATRLPDGTIAVLDGGSQELRLFTAEGAFLQRLSRQGNGPGELQMAAWLGRSGDTLFAYDGLRGGVDVFRPGTTEVPRLRVRAGDGPVMRLAVRDRLSDGQFVVSPGGMRAFEVPAGTVARDTVRLGLLHPVSADSVRWLGRFPASPFFGYKAKSAMSGVGLSRYTLGPQLVVAASGDNVWIGDSGTGEIVRYAASGAVRDTIRWPELARPYDEAALAMAKDLALAEALDDDQRSRVETLYDAALRPAEAPRFIAFTAGVDGEMWVERFRENPHAPRSYLVLDAEGKPRADVTVPAEVTIREVGHDYVLGIRTDADGVETVEVYALERTAHE